VIGRARLPLVAGAALATVLAIAGCATAPVRPAAQWLGVLPPSATLYASLDVATSADVIGAALEKAGPEAGKVTPLLERTTRVYAAFEAGAADTSRISLVALGRYPAGMIRSRLCGSRSWDRVKSPVGTYYAEKKSGLQVGVPGGYAVLVSTGSIETLLGRVAAPIPPAMPIEAAEGMETSDLSLYLPELPGGLPGASSGLALPIREVWLEARRTADRYDLTGTCNAASERDARSLVLLVRLALVTWLRGQGLSDVPGRLKNVAIAADGPQVKLSGLAFGKDEIVAILLALVGTRAAAEGAGP
jgi:hypothetical protein